MSERKAARTGRKELFRSLKDLTLVRILTIIPIIFLASMAHAERVFSIGSLNTADQFINSFKGFRSQMAELGYRDGQNVRYQYYNSRGNDELLRTAAQKLVQEKVDMMVTSSTTATVIAAKATEGTRIPVLFLSAGNAQILVKSFSSSGSNLAGISSGSLELTGKRLELTKELVPQTKKIIMPVDPKGVNYKSIIMETHEAAAKLGLVVSEIHVGSVDQIAKVAAIINRKSYDAIFHAPDSLVTEGIDILIHAAIKEKLALMTSLIVNVKRGCLATYAADYTALGKQGALLADKIFKGAKPSELPIELPSKLNLVLNLKTAKAIDLRVPKDLLLRADEIIE